jgi:RHS repeat-associated protein
LYQQGSVGTSKGFTGQSADSTTGLDDDNARSYDPLVGQCVSADSVQGNLVGMDPYAYVGGNPETWTDPTGHECLEDCGGVPPDDYYAGGGSVTEPGGGSASGASLTTTGITVIDTPEGQYTFDGTNLYDPSGQLVSTMSEEYVQVMQQLANQEAAANPPETPPSNSPETPPSSPQPTNPTTSDGNTSPTRDTSGTDTSTVSTIPTDSESAGTTTVYRVQGGTTKGGTPGSQQRLEITEDGNLKITGKGMLHLNFGDWERAKWWLNNRGPGSYVVIFEVSNEFLDALRELAVPQNLARDFPGFPQIDDPAFPDQYGIPSTMFEWLLESVVPGSPFIGPE